MTPMSTESIFKTVLTGKNISDTSSPYRKENLIHVHRHTIFRGMNPLDTPTDIVLTGKNTLDMSTDIQSLQERISKPQTYSPYRKESLRHVKRQSLQERISYTWSLEERIPQTSSQTVLTGKNTLDTSTDSSYRKEYLRHIHTIPTGNNPLQTVLTGNNPINMCIDSLYREESLSTCHRHDSHKKTSLRCVQRPPYPHLPKQNQFEESS